MTSRGVKWSPALLVAGLVEAPDQLLEDGAHLDVGDRVGMKVDFAELRHDEKEAVRLVELGDLFLEAEMLDDLPGPAGEALDVLGKVGGDVVGIALELLEGEPARVVKRLAGRLVEDGLDVLDLPVLQALELCEDGGLGGFEHAVEAAEDRHRQHDVLVLVRPVRPPEEIRHRPDEVGLVVEVVHSDRFLPLLVPEVEISSYPIRLALGNQPKPEETWAPSH